MYYMYNYIRVTGLDKMIIFGNYFFSVIYCNLIYLYSMEYIAV